MEISDIILKAMFTVFFASLVQGTAGLGFALISVPVMISFMPPKMAIPILLLLGTCLIIIILYDARKSLNIRKMVPVMIFGVLGTPLGTYILATLDINDFKLFMGAIITAIAFLLLFGFKLKIRNEKRALLPIGISSGILQGSLTMCGPPVIFFLLNQNINKMEFRANLAAFIFVMNISAGINFAISGLINAETFRFTLYLIPAMIMGGLSGIWLARKVNEVIFRKIALIIVALSGISTIFSTM